MTHSCTKNNALFAALLAGYLLCGSALAAENQPQPNGEWHVRLTVKTDDGRKDEANVFGRLKDSSQGEDSHDLPEMPPPPPPMGDRYLSIVFPHPEWKSEMPDYASDFRSVPAGTDAGDTWTFEVRTHTPGIPAVLTWEGPADVLRRSRIKEVASGKVLTEDCAAVKSLPVALKKEPVALIWEYQPEKK